MTRDEVARLHDEHGPAALGYAYRLLKDKSACEDVVQEFFLTLLERPLLEIEKPRPYIIGAVRKLVVSWETGESRRIRRMSRTEPVFLMPEQSDEIRDTVVKAIGDLPAEQAEVVHLHRLCEMTFEDIAKVTGESPNTVASRYRYGIEKLKRSLAHLMEAPHDAKP